MISPQADWVGRKSKSNPANFFAIDFWTIRQTSDMCVVVKVVENGPDYFFVIFVRRVESVVSYTTGLAGQKMKIC